MSTLKASWQVRAGLIPGEPMVDYDKAWTYLSADYAADGGTQQGLQADKSLFNEMRVAAHDYASSLERGGFNWVTIEYLWL